MVNCSINLLIVVLLASTIQCFHIDINEGERWCCYRDVAAAGVLRVAWSKHTAVDMDGDLTLHFQILSPTGVSLVDNSHLFTVADGEAVRTNASIPGQYQFCFENTGSITMRLAFDIEIEKPTLVRNDIANTEYTLGEIENSLMSSHDMLKEYREREALHRNTAESTNRRVMVFSIASTIFIIAVTAMQSFTLKSFFKK
eukprot:TRINITY_DN13193_c0_g1_i1.p1 TRINITY_DN13193_c0_g1~~TRINITY_DN13193_c0_g1_i1.p1  ORF type:complete len:199 (+),score=29.15 TRINITY_DN13193_c0_g1_i1:4-600(+)